MPLIRMSPGRWRTRRAGLSQAKKSTNYLGHMDNDGAPDLNISKMGTAKQHSHMAAATAAKDDLRGSHFSHRGAPSPRTVLHHSRSAGRTTLTLSGSTSIAKAHASASLEATVDAA
mgnify:CR=1 FL=1